MHESSFDLEPVGRVPEPYGPGHFRGNRFHVVLRDLSPHALDQAMKAVSEVPRDGLPNYFDDQRFGSVGFGGGFIAQAWLTGDHEGAFRLAMAEPNPSDRPTAKAEKAILRECWGNWAEAKSRLDRSNARSLVTYLVDHPTDFRGAFARLRREMRSLYFSAFQSHLWNLILGRLDRKKHARGSTRPDRFQGGHVADPSWSRSGAGGALSLSRIPLPASRSPLPDGPLREIAEEVVGEFGLSWENLRVKHLKDVFFSKGMRPAIYFAEDLQWTGAPDELDRRRKKLTLSFELPKGAYATLLVKRVTDAAG